MPKFHFSKKNSVFDVPEMPIKLKNSLCVLLQQPWWVTVILVVSEWLMQVITVRCFYEEEKENMFAVAVCNGTKVIIYSCTVTINKG